MHILLTNDDGPPSNQSSPYVHSLVSTLQAAGHKVSVVLPHTQRSWIGKAHMVGQVLTPTYFRPGTLHKDDGIIQDTPFNDGGEEWILLDGTPASCAQVGFHHLFNDRGPVDLILSGPNYGRNTTAVFALSSGTIGAALEGCAMGIKSIALSYAFDSREHDPAAIAAASRLSTQLVEKFMREWPEDVHLYSINVPLQKNLESQKIVYTHMIQNKWFSGSTFSVLPADATDKDPKFEELKIREGNGVKNNNNQQTLSRREHVKFKWSPNFGDVRKFSEGSGSGDGWHVLQGHVTVTPLLANFWHLPHYTGEIKLDDMAATPAGRLSAARPTAIVQHADQYVQSSIVKALKHDAYNDFRIVETSTALSDIDGPVVQFRDYELLDFEHASQHPDESLVCAYVIRKALIRKHYLSNTIATWLVKHPDSILKSHFKPCVHFELDFAEFLDEALVDAWDLNESMAKNEENPQKDWWILKPGMSDSGNGIRLFSSLEQLQTIFEEWEVDEDEDDEEIKDQLDPELGGRQGTAGAMTSQLRHFIAQPYIDPPLLLPAYDNRKFHIRVYVVAVGALKVYVYREMLALFAALPYQDPQTIEDMTSIELGKHLTNTCFQDQASKESSVHRFWSLKDDQRARGWQEKLYDQICHVTGEIFEAAAREQMIHFQAIPNAFEVFGVDFVVDSELNVWLLELNAYPDFKQTGEQLQSEVIGGLFDGVVSVAISPFFGKSSGGKQTESMKLVKDIDLGRR